MVYMERKTIIMILGSAKRIREGRVNCRASALFSGMAAHLILQPFRKGKVALDKNIGQRLSE